MSSNNLRDRARELRESGKSYREIESLLGVNIAKSTLSYWLNDVALPDSYVERKAALHKTHLERIRGLSVRFRKIQRQEYFDHLVESNAALRTLLQDKQIAKIVLAILYAAEGSKAKGLRHSNMVFGNSDQYIISLFLELLRRCYVIDEKKFRCTVQCRADQNTEFLQQFWAVVTKIPYPQFYKPLIDKRTVGKPTRKFDYKGVCRVEYLSAAVFWDIMITAEILTGARSLVVKR